VRGSPLAVAFLALEALTYTTTAPATASTARSVPWARLKMAAIALAAVCALAFRVSDLSTYGFSEDEINKVRAIEQYRGGHFTANAEHPMLMKLAMWASVDLARAWNRVAPAAAAIAPETALRLPNAIAGAAVTVAIAGIADLLFGGVAAVTVSAIWAFDVNVIAINRIGKEDTFLVLFFLFAVFSYERAKRMGVDDPIGAQRWYAASGVCFGLMLASKYMPHLLGIYALFNGITDPQPGANRPNKLAYYVAMLAAFALADPVIFLPETWRYCFDYVRGEMQMHHGYLYAGGLYVTDVPISPLGVPPTFYLRVLALKTPLVVLAALVPGVIQMVRRHRDRGMVLLRVLIVLLLVPYSLMAAKFLRYTLPMLAVIDLIAAIGLVEGVRWLLRKQWLAPITRTTVAALAVLVFAVGLVQARDSAAPFYSLFQNAIGERIDPSSAAVPEATYDYGVREAVALTAAVAPHGTVLASDAPAVVDHYLSRFGRTDIRAGSLSGDGLSAHAPETWVLVQAEHATFENALTVDALSRREAPWAQVYAGDRLAVQLFRMPER
jgi:hypothetical protein